MPFARKISLFAGLVACLLLTACAGGGGWNLGQLSWPGGGQQQFHPLDSEMAALAAPMGSGPRLVCRTGRGTALFGKAWAPFGDATFSIPAGSRVNIALAKASGRGETLMQGLFDKEGQKIIFCPVVEGPPDARIACTSLYALDDDLAAGLKRTFDVPELVRGASITCAFAPENLKKLD